MSSRGLYKEMLPHNEYQYHSYEHSREERKENLYSDSGYSSSYENLGKKSSHRRLRPIAHETSNSYVKPIAETKKIVKKGSMPVSDSTEASGIRFIKKHWDKLKHSDQKIMEIKYEEASYYGQVKVNSAGESIRHGLGGLYYTSGRYYEGEWSNGLRHGKGFERFENLNTYQGDYVKGKAHGKGTYKWRNGEIYTGEWKEGLRDGKGKWVGTAGDSYEGDWQQGKAHGYGVHIWKNGR
jgi:hypothetical protein